jgi:sigma-B regulation protein RsbU (phosphoserine phosphatase)
VLGTVSGIDRLGWFGHAPTGDAIGYKLVLLFTIGGGKIVRDERIYDSVGVMERLEKARIDKELRTAAEVQRMLLSRTAHVNAYSESVADSVPCRAIGGDFFEIVVWQSGSVGLAMGDVAGKGPAAALLASMLQGMLSTEARGTDGPAATLTRINQGLAERHVEARFATLVYAVLAPDGNLTYANAGHNPPALVSGDHITRLTAGGPILGVFADARFDEASLRLTPGDLLVMFTDGATEALNRLGDQFGDERLIACVRRPSSSASDVLGRVFSALRTFTDGAEPTDDITVTVTRFLGAP